MIQIIFLEGPTRFILPSLQKTEWASEDPNLPIDDRRKIELLYRPWRNTYDRIYVAGGAELMWKTPTKFRI